MHEPAVNSSAVQGHAEVVIKRPTGLTSDPEDGLGKLLALTGVAHKRRRVGESEHSDTLEIFGSASLGALAEWLEAYLIGLFLDEPELSGNRLLLLKSESAG